MACQCGTAAGGTSQAEHAKRADVACGCGSSSTAEGGCGCGTTSTPEGGCGCGTPAATEDMDVAALARLVKDLDQRVRELEMDTSHT
jgi:hypothetical protein